MAESNNREGLPQAQATPVRDSRQAAPAVDDPFANVSSAAPSQFVDPFLPQGPDGPQQQQEPQPQQQPSIAPQGSYMSQKDRLLYSLGASAGIVAMAGGYYLYRRSQNAQGEPDYRYQPSPQDIEARALIDSGKASVDDILRNSFGEWPPKGLNIIGQNTLKIDIQSEVLDKDYYQRRREMGKNVDDPLGNYRMGGQRIGVNGEYYDSRDNQGISTTLGHETAHHLQDATGHAPSPTVQVRRFGERYSQRVSASVMYEASDQGMANLFKEHAGAAPSPDGEFSYYFKSDEYGPEYFQKGIEIQARVHEIMAEGYKHWGRMPTNHEEYYVAMQDAGVRLPQNILDELDRSPTIEQTRATFQTGQFTSRATDLNYAQAYLTEAGQEQFWRKNMPAVYADLIEMYGDDKGRERFGMGKNPRAEIRLGSSIDAKNEDEYVDRKAAALKSIGADRHSNSRELIMNADIDALIEHRSHAHVYLNSAASSEHAQRFLQHSDEKLVEMVAKKLGNGTATDASRAAAREFVENLPVRQQSYDTRGTVPVGDPVATMMTRYGINVAEVTPGHPHYDMVKSAYEYAVVIQSDMHASNSPRHSREYSQFDGELADVFQSKTMGARLEMATVLEQDVRLGSRPAEQMKAVHEFQDMARAGKLHIVIQESKGGTVFSKDNGIFVAVECADAKQADHVKALIIESHSKGKIYESTSNGRHVVGVSIEDAAEQKLLPADTQVKLVQGANIPLEQYAAQVKEAAGKLGQPVSGEYRGKTFTVEPGTTIEKTMAAIASQHNDPSILDGRDDKRRCLAGRIKEELAGWNRTIVETPEGPMLEFSHRYAKPNLAVISGLIEGAQGERMWEKNLLHSDILGNNKYNVNINGDQVLRVPLETARSLQILGPDTDAQLGAMPIRTEEHATSGKPKTPGVIEQGEGSSPAPKNPSSVPDAGEHAPSSPRSGALMADPLEHVAGGAAPKAPSVTMTRIANGTTAAGIGLGAFGIVKTYFSEAYKQDVDAGGLREFYARGALGLRTGGLVLGVAGVDNAAGNLLVKGAGYLSRGAQAGEGAAVNIAASCADEALKMTRMGSFLGGVAKGGKFLGVAGSIIQCVAGNMEYKAAKEAGDAYRAANARGSTIGGIVAGIGTGFAVGWETGPGAIVTMIGGGIIGGYVGGVIDEKAFGEDLQKEFDAQTQQKIDTLSTQTGKLIPPEMLERFGKSTGEAQKYGEALKAYYAAEQKALANPADPQGVSHSTMAKAAEQLEEAGKKAQELPHLSYPEYKAIRDVQEELGKLYARESLRIVPEGDTAAEANRKQNIEQLAEAYKKTQVILGIDSVNSQLGNISHKHTEHAKEFTTGLGLASAMQHASDRNNTQELEALGTMFEMSERRLQKIDAELAESMGIKPQVQPELELQPGRFQNTPFMPGISKPFLRPDGSLDYFNGDRSPDNSQLIRIESSDGKQPPMYIRADLLPKAEPVIRLDEEKPKDKEPPKVPPSENSPATADASGKQQPDTANVPEHLRAALAQFHDKNYQPKVSTTEGPHHGGVPMERGNTQRLV